MELEKMMQGAMEFNFSPILAKEIGLNGAIVLSAIELYRKENSKKNNVIDYKCIQGKYLPFYSICTISRIVKRLVDTGYLDKIKMTPEQIKNMVIQNKNSPLFSCEWCGCGCNILHEHHYPTPKRLGGTKTVKICPNCHYEFHAISKKMGE